MSPGSGHWFRHLARVQVCEDLLYATKFGDGVNFVSSERMDKLLFVVLGNELADSKAQDVSNGRKDKKEIEHEQEWRSERKDRESEKSNAET